MIRPGEIKEEISIAPHSQVLGRHEPNKSISGHNGSLMIEKPGVILNDDIGGESSDIPHTQKLNSRKRRKRSPSGSYRSDASIAMQQSMKSTPPPWHKVFNYLNPSLIGLVAAKYQGKSEDPFKANPAPSWSSLATIVMCCLISSILMEFQSHPTRFLPFLSRVASASGVVSSLSLISLLLPQLPGLILLYTSWALFVVISGWPILQSAYNWLLTKIKTVTDVVISFARNLFTPDNNSQQQRPPVSFFPTLVRFMEHARIRSLSLDCFSLN